MHAIANRVQINPTIRYVTAEQFTNELINYSLRTYDAFHQTYRVEDSVLLIDDAQFFTGKERTQEGAPPEFSQARATDVLAADILPRDIDDLEPRLRADLKVVSSLTCSPLT